MDQNKYDTFLNILKEELIPAAGCTEPVALAYAAAIARKTLGSIPDKVEIQLSGNILKNAKSVTIPNTDGLKGIPAAVAAGIIAGDSDKGLEAISYVTQEQIEDINKFLNQTDIKLINSDNSTFYIALTASNKEHSAYVRITGNHTNVVLIKRDDIVIMSKDDIEPLRLCQDNRKLLNVEEIVLFADIVALEDIEDLISKQIEYNMAISFEGLNGDWGAGIGKTLINAYGNSVHNRAKAMAAAGSDARMSGCELPVVINSGSGNQGITSSVPVIVYAKELKIADDLLYRALVVSNLVTIHMKTGIGKLSAYCGATSAGCGAGAGICYLLGGNYDEIAHTIVNAVAINSGMICDGAKASCAAKIAMAVEAGLLGMNMYKGGNQFYSGDGIVIKGVDNTIQNVSEMARDGMLETDKKIIKLMLDS
jgi:L-cysteine desulfidase